MVNSLTLKGIRDTPQNTIFTFSSSSQPSSPPPPPVFTFPSSSTPPPAFTFSPFSTKPPSPPSFTFSSSTTTPLPSPPSPSPPGFTFSSCTHSQPPFTFPCSSSTPIPAFIFSTSSTKPPSPSSFTFSSSTTTPLPPPPSPLPPVCSFPSSLTPLSSPPVFTFSSSSKLSLSPPVFTFSSSSSSTPPPPPPSPPIYFSFPSSSTPLPPPPIFTFSSSSSSTPQPPAPPAVSPSPSRVRKRFLKTQRKVAVNDDDKKEAEAEGVICEICAESRRNDDMYRNRNCQHSFCCECITKQVATKIQESITVVSCPALNCNGELELDACRAVLPKELTEKWENAACEALFVAAPKLYCPFRDCSAMLLVEKEEEAIREAECPFCHRLFCARCGVPWHTDVACEELQSLNEDERGREDLLLRDLAGQKKWNRCPRCKFYVEKTEGCLHITCRCRFEFCYACGEPWTTTHGGCQRN